MEQGFDPELRKFFSKIMSTFFAGFMWMMLNILIGMYIGLAYIHSQISIANIIYYILSLTGLVALIWYYIKLWRK